MQKEIHIGNKIIGAGHPPFIIAEMACAHDGDFEKAKKLIDSAVDANADAVQLQFFRAEETVTPSHPVYDVLRKIEFTEKEWTELFQYACSKKILVFICTYDLPSVEFATRLKADGIKLNSADLSNPEVVQAVASSGIPFTLGTGASTIEEIAAGINLAKSNGADKIILMHGVQNFPTKIEDLNIQRVELLRDVFDMPVGYHDHTSGEDPLAQVIDLVALGLKACVLEKHITIDRNEKGIDYQAALEPIEFKDYVARTKAIRAFTESDLRYRKFQKKSIVAASELVEGEVLVREKVKFIRSEEPGLPPSAFDSILGKKLKKNLRKYQIIELADID
jgi:sialic acid synthase SpsE